MYIITSGVVWALFRLHGPALAAVSFVLAAVSLCSPSLAAVDLRWLLWACTRLRWLLWAVAVGCCGRRPGQRWVCGWLW